MFRAVLYSDLDFESPPWPELSPQAREFVESLLQRDEAARPTAEQALQHPWLREEEGAGPSDAPLSATIVQRLQRYGTYGHFRQAVLRQVAHAFGERAGTSLAELRQLFRQLDGSGRGRVSREHLRSALLEGQFDVSDEEAEQLLAQLDLDQTGEIDVYEFLAAMVDWQAIRVSSAAAGGGLGEGWQSWRWVPCRRRVCPGCMAVFSWMLFVACKPSFSLPATDLRCRCLTSHACPMMTCRAPVIGTAWSPVLSRALTWATMVGG